ncbi:MAG: YCF48-related protein, partial [FCB group bacterium]
MHRLFRLSFLLVLFSILTYTVGYAAKPQLPLSGRVEVGDVRVLLKDTTYFIDNEYVIKGTLIVEPGTTILFYPNGRLVDSCGGRIIADGFATATYKPNPYSGSPWNIPIDPKQVVGSTSNPYHWIGYNDLKYFLYGTAKDYSYLHYINNIGGYGSGPDADRTIVVQTPYDYTVDTTKYRQIFDVVLDTAGRRLLNLQGNGLGTNSYPYPTNGFYRIPFEYAIMFMAARMNVNPVNDYNLARYPWSRIGDLPVDVTPGQINFVGQPVQDFSREWGHIIILPGARAAFFRNCVFNGLRKDTTVDRTGFYNPSDFPMFNSTQLTNLNQNMKMASNGGGGAITTFSSRTWILNCIFTCNFARHKGGALQILQAPEGFPRPSVEPGWYLANKNPNLTDRDGILSRINTFSLNQTNTNIKAIDYVDENLISSSTLDEPLSNYDRQYWDDGRISVYLGRVRNLYFVNNIAQLANVKRVTIGTPPVEVVRDDTLGAADAPQYYGDIAYGGAIYIAGASGTYTVNESSHSGSFSAMTGFRTDPFEVGLGVNNSITTYPSGIPVVHSFPLLDSLTCDGNFANNYQNISTSMGARGGAIYVGKFTSLIVAGEFMNNAATSLLMQNDTTPSNSGYFARGGAIFVENSKNRLQVRGGPNRDFGNNIDNPTLFLNNKAGSGGAIYVDPITNYFPVVLPWEPTIINSSYLISPVIGGSDTYIYTRDYGFNITFKNNVALSYGGAVFTNRNMFVNGAGGVTNNTFLGYGGAYPVMFDANSAGYSGGAVHIRVTDNSDIATTRTVQMIRASFRNNIVGANIVEANKPQIRGGGAIYCQGADLNLMKGIEIKANTVYNGNGGGISLVTPHVTNKRFFLTDLDNVAFQGGIDRPAISYSSENGVLAYLSTSYTPDARMLTMFLDNQIICDSLLLASQSGSGTTQIGKGTPAFDQALYGVCFLDETNGYVVGENGTIIQLTQGGNLWKYINSTTTNNLRDIDFLTDSVGFIVGEYGTVLRTTDKGNTWTPQSVTPLPGWNPTLQHFYGIKFSGSSSNIGYLVGTGGFIAKIQVELVGGSYVSSTITQVPSGTIHNLFGIYFNRVHLGYAVGERGLIIKLNDLDGWDGQISNIFTDLRSVYFTNDYTGYAVGDYGVLLKTTNAGYSWDLVNTGTSLLLNKIWFTGLNVGYTAGENGVMFKTTDAGATWNPLNPGTTNNINSIFFKIPAVGYIVGDNGFLSRTSDAGATWQKKVSQDLQYVDVVRRAQEVKLPENGIGLGGALYILDSVTTNRVNRSDSLHFNRTRMLRNFAYSGSAVYSDNYDLKLIFNRSLIVNNMVDPRNTIGIYQNAITGAVLRDSSKNIIANKASSDLASTCLYGEIQGPIPSFSYSEAANSIYNNTARFSIRLPDAPNTKGVLAGLATGVGFGGTDSLRGNYWGKTEANISYIITDSCVNCPHKTYKGAVQETFFLDTMDLVGPYTYQRHKYLDFVFWETNAENAALHNNPRFNSYLFEGPFEAITRFNYQPIPLLNKIGVDENTPADSSIPEILVQSGRVYDIYDKGTDIKTADYSARRMSPIEDFAVGIPPVIRNYTDNTQPSYGKYVKRWVRDPFIADSMDENNTIKYGIINTLQTEFRPWVSPAKDTMYYHPIGYPLFLETAINYNGIDERTNQDNRLLNESVFFVINETTNDYIRINLKQVSDEAPYREIFRGRVDLVPDSTNRNDNTTIRRTNEGLANFGSDIGDPHLLRALYHNPYNEDAATLQGRKYHAPKDQLGNDPTLYSNRPDMPASNNKFGVNYETYFAGERFRALPVNVGDSISVVSRTVLWRQGVDTALRKGLAFTITNSTMPPEFTGDIYHLQTDTIVKYVPSEFPWRNKNGVFDTLKITDFLNKVFLTEDREYPKPVGTYSQPSANIGKDAVGRDRILNATAKDFNKFYDPRSFPLGGQYAQLYYRWAPANGGEGLVNWLKSELIPSNANYVTNPQDEAQGYLILRGRPTNPYVVPGGEEAIIYAQNYPPNYRTIDSLLATPPNTFTQDQIDKFIYLFTPYLHTPTYDAY